MLNYEWGNPSNVVMLSPDTDSDSIHGSDPTKPHHHQHNHTSTFPDHYASSQASAFNNLVSSPPPPPPPLPHHQTATFADHFNPTHHQAQQLHSVYDLHAYTNTSTYVPPHHHHSMLGLDPIHGGAANGLMLIRKTEDMCLPMDCASRIGLNLGGRTYFASEDDFMNRLYSRSRPGSEITSPNSPCCQAEAAPPQGLRVTLQVLHRHRQRVYSAILLAVLQVKQIPLPPIATAIFSMSKVPLGFVLFVLPIPANRWGFVPCIRGRSRGHLCPYIIPFFRLNFARDSRGGIFFGPEGQECLGPSVVLP